MFSVFVYLFSVAVSFRASFYFRKAWRKTGNQNHYEFSWFFAFLGTGLALYMIPNGMLAEIGNFIVLFSFAFVLRAFARFQQIKSVSPNFISSAILILASIKFGIGISNLPQPVMLDSLIYWHYAIVDAVAFSVCIVLFTLAMAVTFLSNLANVRKNKMPLLFLGLAFFFGGIGGSLVVLTNDFWPLLTSYIFIFSVFVFVTLFIFSSRKGEA